MGGSVFSEYADAVRIDREEHDEIASKVASVLSDLEIDASPIPALRSKTSFGDVDMVVSRAQTHRGLPESGDELVSALAVRDSQIAQALGADAYHRGNIRNPALHMLIAGRNGPVQLDLMSIEDNLLEFATRHLSWGDAGAMAAAIAQQMGLKAGMNGLAIAVNIGASRHRLPLSLDYDQTLELLGLDSAVHRRGFDTINDVYEWLAAGRYFNPRLWSHEWMTNRTRHRALKRDSYVGLYEWLEHKRPAANYDWGEARGARTAEWIDHLLDTYPEARAELHRLQNMSMAPQGLRAFFNGDVVRQYVDVDNESLQHVMNNLRKRIGIERLQALSDAQDHDGLTREIRKHID